MPCDVAMARTWDGNSYALRGAQSMTALGPTAAAYRARVFRKLIRKQRQHREIGWRCEIRDERFRIGFLQIVGISHDNEAFVDAERAWCCTQPRYRRPMHLCRRTYRS